jgi:cyanophycinase
MRRCSFLAVLLLALASSCANVPASSGTAAASTTGVVRSARGSLVIVGGGPRSEPVMQKFVQLAGGAERARVIVFPMASSLAETGPESVEAFRRMGVTAWSANLSRDDALRPETARGLDSATGIWFPGGDQARITAVLVGTPVERAIRARYEAGAVVGGTSAGAAVMSTPMLTGDERHPGGARPDTTQSFITIARDNVVVTQGLGLAGGAIIDQHFLRRRRHNRLISLVLEHPELVGVGIDESTALVIEPGQPWRVLGASAVVVYDARHSRVTPASQTLGATDIRMHVLPAGSQFDPRTGQGELP